MEYMRRALISRSTTSFARNRLRQSRFRSSTITAQTRDAFYYELDFGKVT
jgi:hypothetical protein